MTKRARPNGGRSPKVRTGLALDREVVAALDNAVQDLVAFGPTRSEVVGAILKDFLESTPSYKSRVMELVARYRIRRP